MRKIYLLFILTIMSIAVSAQVQPPHAGRVQPISREALDNREKPTPEQEAEKHTQMLVRRLQLDSAQIDTVYKIHLKYARLRHNTSDAEQRKTLFGRMLQELKAVLTEQQFAEMLEMQRQVRAGRPPMMPQGR